MSSYIFHHPQTIDRNFIEEHPRNEMDSFWAILETIRFLEIQSQTFGYGNGLVRVEKEPEDQIIFYETGAWDSGVCFFNTLRWKKERDWISLEHLRQGKDQPVSLLQFRSSGAGCLNAMQPHLCTQDSYNGRIEFSQAEIRLTWNIQGPRKNETLIQIYRIDAASID